MSEKTGIKKIDLHYCLNTRLTKQVLSFLHIILVIIILLLLPSLAFFILLVCSLWLEDINVSVIGLRERK